MKNKGFTLIELMITVAVAGILIAITGYNLMPMIARMNVESDAKELSQLMRDAQERSISRGIPVQIAFTKVSADSNLIATVQYLTVPPQAAGTQRFTKSSPGTLTGVTIVTDVTGTVPASGIGFTNGLLMFDPSGGTTTPGVIYLIKKNFQYAVSVNANGRIRYWKWGGASGWQF